MEPDAENRPRRRATNLSIDSRLIEEAKSLGIQLSRSAEAGIAQAIAQARRERWLAENAQALESSNAWVDANGLPMSAHRRF